MIYRQMSICDVEPVYLKRLATYLNRHPGFLWRIKTYTDLKQCLRETPEVLIVSGNALTDFGQGQIDENSIPVRGCQVILLEDEQGSVAQWPAVAKYQSAKRLYEDLLEILGEDVTGKTEIIGIYGPSSGPEAEKMATEIGKEFLSTGEVLLIPLTEFSTFSEGDLDNNGIGEWFYYQLQGQEGGKRMSDWVYSEGDMDYLKGFRTVYDRREVTLEAWRCFWTEALRKSRYGTAILVFDRLPEYIELLMWCDRIYVQWGRDGFGDFRKQQFTKMAAYMGMDELMDKLIEK
jgi:hypothetical protein